jgi:hypothetical protein
LEDETAGDYGEPEYLTALGRAPVLRHTDAALKALET